jgi:hypothetical protein
MSDRTRILTVVLDDTYRVDDTQAIMDTIKMIKGVLDVEVNVSDITTYAAFAAARQELGTVLFNILNENKNKGIKA